MQLLKKGGHSIGNHTYSHIHAYDSSAKDYLKDVEHANDILKSKLFRPPHGSLTVSSWIKLHKKYNVIYWALNSEDPDLDNFDFDHAISLLKEKTRAGDVVLFHFCHRHENETRKLLPEYLKWLHEQGFESKAIE